MFKELIVALICVVSFNSAAHVPHAVPTKKQVTYSGYSNVPAFYQDSSQYYGAANPQSQAGVAGQGQTFPTSAGTSGALVKQQFIPQKSTGYPVSNAVPTQFAYPFKQYYPQIYPQNSQYPTVPSVFYVPGQGRYPSASEGSVSNEGTTGGQGGSPGSWFTGWNQVPANWQSPQLPQLPQGAGSYPQFPSLPNYPANLPQFPSQFPTQFPQFPSNFPTGSFPTFPGSAPAGASPAVVPGSETVAGATTNNDGHSVVVVSARKPEKIESGDSNAEGVNVKNEVDKVVGDFPPQQYILLQPQYLVPNGGQVPIYQTAAGKDPVQLDGAAKGAISSFLFQQQQQQQPALAQPASAQQYSQVTPNKLYSPQEFQELLQQVQAANKKLIESGSGSSVPQFYQQSLPQVGVAQQSVNSQAQSQDVSSQPVQGLVPQQYIFQGGRPIAQIQQPYFNSPEQPQQIFFPQFASLPQPKPVVGEVSNVPGAAFAYQRFLLENQKPIKSSFVGAPNVEGTAPVSGAGPTPVSVPSISSSLPANDSTSSPEPSNNADSESTGNSADEEIRNEANEIPFNDVTNIYQSTSASSTPVSTQDVGDLSGTLIQVAKPSGNYRDEANEEENVSSTENTNNEQSTPEFGARLNFVKPKGKKIR